MIFYLTLNEAPSGIFSSQVIDVVKFIDKNLQTRIKLVAFISLRGFFLNRKKIKSELPNAIVLPMYPKMQNWKRNSFLMNIFCLMYQPHTIIARSVIATQLALRMRDKNKCNKVVYDGRGAIEAEWKEYKVINSDYLLKAIASYEKEAVLKSDNRIAVSNALVTFWKTNYSYHKNKHVVIPCTLNSDFKTVKLTHSLIIEKRKQLSINENDTVYIYSGSVAGWQSFDILFLFIKPILEKSATNKIVFFSQPNTDLDKLQKLFPNQVICKHLKSNEVAQNLIVGDYGLLIREQSVTNLVASPVKFAEYLACGLKVIISERLGDYTELSLQNNWGFVYANFDAAVLKPTLIEKQKISIEAVTYFSKENYKEEYSLITNH